MLKSLEAKDRFRGLVEASFSTPPGRVAFLFYLKRKHWYVCANKKCTYLHMTSQGSLAMVHIHCHACQVLVCISKTITKSHAKNAKLIKIRHLFYATMLNRICSITTYN